FFFSAEGGDGRTKEILDGMAETGVYLKAATVAFAEGFAVDDGGHGRITWGEENPPPSKPEGGAPAAKRKPRRQRFPSPSAWMTVLMGGRPREKKNLHVPTARVESPRRDSYRMWLESSFSLRARRCCGGDEVSIGEGAEEFAEGAAGFEGAPADGIAARDERKLVNGTVGAKNGPARAAEPMMDL